MTVQLQAAACAQQELTPSRLLGELLVEQGFFSYQRLERLLAEELATGAEINELVVRQGLVSETELATALIELLGDDVMCVKEELHVKPDFKRLDAELAQVETLGQAHSLGWTSEDRLPANARPTGVQKRLSAVPPSASETHQAELDALQHGIASIETALADVKDMLTTIQGQADASRHQNSIGFA